MIAAGNRSRTERHDLVDNNSTGCRRPGLMEGVQTAKKIEEKAIGLKRQSASECEQFDVARTRGAVHRKNSLG
jgi:hypothetical protein